MNSNWKDVLAEVGRQNDAHWAANYQDQSWQVILADEDFVKKNNREDYLDHDGSRTIEG